MNTAQPSLRETTNTVETTLAASSVELGNLAHMSKEIQWAISSLLETAHHPDITVEMQVLQDIDRLQQTLVDLSKLMDAISVTISGDSTDIQHLQQLVRLDSLRARLFSEGTPALAETDDEDVTWF